MYVYSYNEHSNGAKQLASSLGIKRIKHENSRFRGVNKNIINWGSSSVPMELLAHNNVINDPTDIARCTNKLTFFQLMREREVELLCVPFTTDRDVVRSWLRNERIVVARQKLTGHSGEGIVLLEGVDAEIPNAPLYTLYIPKKEEYRVHMFRNRQDECRIFDIQKKARKNDVPDEEVNWRVRNLDGGFIYARENVVLPPIVKEVAEKVFSQTLLDFGALDIIYNDKKGTAFVLEVNTAPGLTGITLDNYVHMFREMGYD